MSAADARLGATIAGKYRIVRFLAAGGVGTVYEGQDVAIQRRCAVKFLRAELLRRRDVLARFKLEATAAATIESEHIAAAIDFGVTQQGEPYLVMEYLEGIELGALLAARGPLTVERATDLVAQACAGMQRAHDTGVLHRDLKPQNLFVCRRTDQTDLVKIVDFGVAKLLDEDAASKVTSTGSVVGTPAYMSPEQARGALQIDRRTDVYALGAILYELLSGRTPHPGASHNAVIHHISTQPALPLACEGLPLPLVAAVERALAMQPENRPASAADFAHELLPFARRQAWPVVSASSSPALDPTLLADADQPSPSPLLPERRWRSTWLAASAVVVLAVVVLGLALWPAPRLPASTASGGALSEVSSASSAPQLPTAAISGSVTAEGKAASAAAEAHAGLERTAAATPRAKATLTPTLVVPAPASAPRRNSVKPPSKPKHESLLRGKAGAEFDTDNPY